MIEILNIRGMKVILDSDLAKLCECDTKHVNETRKRSLRKFGSFQLTKEENEPIKQQKMLSKFKTTHVPWVYLIEDALRIARILTKNIGKKYKEKSFEQDVINVCNLQSWKLEKNNCTLRDFTLTYYSQMLKMSI